MELLSADEEELRTGAAQCLGAALPHVSQADMQQVLGAALQGAEGAAWQLRHGLAMALGNVLLHNAGALRVLEVAGAFEQLSERAQELAKDDKPPVREWACVCAAELCALSGGAPAADAGTESDVSALLKALAVCIEDSNADVRRRAADATKRFGLSAPDVATKPKTLSRLVPGLLKGAKEPNIPVKNAMERALQALLLPAPEDTEVLDAYVKGAAAADGQSARDIAKRVLSKLQPPVLEAM